VLQSERGIIVKNTGHVSAVASLICCDWPTPHGGLASWGDWLLRVSQNCVVPVAWCTGHATPRTPRAWITTGQAQSELAQAESPGQRYNPALGLVGEVLGGSSGGTPWQVRRIQARAVSDYLPSQNGLSAQSGPPILCLCHRHPPARLPGFCKRTEMRIPTMEGQIRLAACNWHHLDWRRVDWKFPLFSRLGDACFSGAWWLVSSSLCPLACELERSWGVGKRRESSALGAMQADKMTTRDRDKVCTMSEGMQPDKTGAGSRDVLGSGRPRDTDGH